MFLMKMVFETPFKIKTHQNKKLLKKLSSHNLFEILESVQNHSSCFKMALKNNIIHNILF